MTGLIRKAASVCLAHGIVLFVQIQFLSKGSYLRTEFNVLLKAVPPTIRNVLSNWMLTA